MSLSAAELALMGIAVDAISKIVTGAEIGGKQATMADVEDAKNKLDKAKGELNAAIKEKQS
ncbi:MAG: hypothetical protein IMZ61_10415 [Planctomycetes bacterium]|nr:hypothetical protein [Planctomycetota bacterium]